MLYTLKYKSNCFTANLLDKGINNIAVFDDNSGDLIGKFSVEHKTIVFQDGVRLAAAKLTDLAVLIKSCRIVAKK